jgi:hypothetical protein
MARLIKLKTRVDLIQWVKKTIDIRDVFVFGGLGMLGYGLYLLQPWLGWTVTGGLLMGLGIFVGKRD